MINPNIDNTTCTNSQKLNKETEQGSYRAYLFMILSAFCFVTMQLNFKQFMHYVPPMLALGIRASLPFIANLYVMKYVGIDWSVKQPATLRLLIGRSSISFFTVALYSTSIKYIPIGIANALHNTSPIMTFFIQLIYYRRSKVQWANLVIITCCFSGILLITQPEFLFGSKNQLQKNNYIYYAMVLLAAFTSSFSMLLLHDLRDKCHELVALQYSYIVQGWGSYVFYLFFIGPSDYQQHKFKTLTLQEIAKVIFFIIGMSCFAYITQFLRVKSIYLCSPAMVLPFNYLNVVLGLVVDILVFGSHYNWMIILGMILASAGLLSKFILLKINNNKSKQNT